jgi:hypothetical protein
LSTFSAWLNPGGDLSAGGIPEGHVAVVVYVADRTAQWRSRTAGTYFRRKRQPTAPKPRPNRAKAPGSGTSNNCPRISPPGKSEVWTFILQLLPGYGCINTWNCLIFLTLRASCQGDDRGPMTPITNPRSTRRPHKKGGARRQLHARGSRPRDAVRPRRLGEMQTAERAGT